jgi:antitoxin component YwqK of YwqJK toxin-antitoxin module
MNLKNITFISLLGLSMTCHKAQAQLDEGKYSYSSKTYSLTFEVSGGGREISTATLVDLSNQKRQTIVSGTGAFISNNNIEWYQFDTKECHYEFDFKYNDGKPMQSLTLHKSGCKNGDKNADNVLSVAENTSDATTKPAGGITATHESPSLSPTSKKIILDEYFVGYSISSIIQYGVKQATSKDQPVDGEFTRENPLIRSTHVYKAKNGSDSSVVARIMIGKFVNGYPKGLIMMIELDGDRGGQEESTFNEKMELVKYVWKEKSQLDHRLEVETIEFLNKCPIRYESSKDKFTYQNGQIVKIQKFNTQSGQMVSEGNYIFNPKDTKPCDYRYNPGGGGKIGIKNGTFKSWDGRGNKESEENYLNGEKNGTCTEYNNGKIYKTEKYKNGVLLGK